MNPFGRKLSFFKVYSFRSAFHFLLRQSRDVHLQRNGSIAIDYRPGVLIPPHRSQIRFTSQCMMSSRHNSVCQTNHPPRTIGAFHQISMPCSLNRTGLSRFIGMGQNRICRISLIRPVNATAAGNGYFMSQFRTALRNQQIVPAVFLINVRTLGISASSAVPYSFGRRKLFACHGVNLTQVDVSIRITDHKTFAILKIKRRIDASLLEPDWFRPFTTGISSMYQEIPLTGDISRNHVKHSIIVTNGRSENTASRISISQIKLGRTGQTVSYLLPMHKVFTVKQRHSGEILKAAVD